MKEGKSYFASTFLTILLIVATIAPFYGSSDKTGIILLSEPEGWSEDVRLTNNTFVDYKVTLAADNNDVHIAWATFRDTKWRVYYSNSKDSGRTWNNETELAQPRTNPDIASVGDNVHMVCDSGMDIFYRRSTNGGQNWDTEKMISTNDGFNSQGPKIFVNDSNIHISWMDLRDGNDGEIYYRRSLDGGATFDDGQGVDEDRRITFSPAAITQTRMAGYGSNISVVWSDMRDGNWDIYWMISKNNGVDWEDGQGMADVGRKISNDPTSSGPAAVAMSGSNIHIVWVDEVWPGPVYYLNYRNSTDSGINWNPVQLLTGPTQMIASPAIAVEGSDVNIVWDDSRDGDKFKPEIYYKNSTDGGITWGDDVRLTYNLTGASQWPRIALAEEKRHVVWWDDRDSNNEIYYKRFLEVLPDTASPEIRHDAIVPTAVSHLINITANVTDDVGVDVVFLNYTGVNGTSHNVTMTRWNGNWSYDIPGQDNIGIVEYFIWANDTSGNANQTMNHTVQIIDITAPLIVHTPPASAPLDTPISITATVTDDVGVANVTLHYQNVGDTAYTSVDMILDNGNWTATIPAQGKTGIVHYFIRANDTSGNNATSPVMGDYSIQIIGPPGIVITGPKGGEIFTGGSIQQIDFTVTDTEDSPSSLTVFLNYTSGAGDVFIEQVTGASSPYSWTLPKINATDVRVNATVIDSDGNKAYANSPMFTIDSTLPRIVSTNPANNSTGISVNQAIVIQFSEPMNITSVVVNQTNGTDPGGWQWFWNETGNTLTGIHGAWPRGETIEITVQAGYMDESDPGNANNTAYVFTFITEVNPLPEIVHANISSPQELGDAIRINATITDDGTVMNAVLWWRDVDGIWRESRMQKTGDNWEFILPGQMAEGRVRYQINATDDLGQKNSTIIYEFDVEDSTPPVISHTPVANAVIGGPINITCQVTDLGGVDVVYLHYRNESEANFTELAMNPGYWYELAARSLPITIEYYIMAVDQYGNEALTGIYSLEIINPTVPDTTPPGILFVGPTGNNIPITASISIVFTEVVDRASVEGTIIISPAVSGITYTWLNDQTLIVSFNALQYNTTYAISIGTGPTDLAGNALATAHSWQFTTATEPEVVQQPAPNNWGWIVIIILLVAIIALMLLYLFYKEKKDPDIINKKP